jgi:hypothetical protein
MGGLLPSGRPRKIGESLHPIVRELATKMNKSGKPVAAPKLAKVFKEEHNIFVYVRSLRRVLRQMGIRFIKGKSRNIMAESATNVAFRAQYLRKKVANLSRRGFPIRPEVYLDETFCNLHHTASRGSMWTNCATRKAVVALGKCNILFNVVLFTVLTLFL